MERHDFWQAAMPAGRLWIIWQKRVPAAAARGKGLALQVSDERGHAHQLGELVLDRLEARCLD